MFEVAVILSLIWGAYYLLVRRRIQSGIVFFVFLFCMAIPSFFQPEFLQAYIESSINITNITILAIVLIVSFKPWRSFDRAVKDRVISINYNYIKNLRFLFLFTIVGSLYAILYLMPYAIAGVRMGAADVRALISDVSVLPKNILTTIAVSFAALYIYNILFFYIACLSDELKRYRIWLVISSLSYLVSCMAITARDGFIILPVFYVCLYIIFRRSIPQKTLRSIKRYLTRLSVAAFVMLSSFTISRFWGTDKDVDRLLDGTVGYIAQQPYVFDSTVQHQDDFHGLELRFPLINRIVGIKEYKIDRLDNWFETCFGTMYADFYNIGGWLPVFIILAVFVLYYYWVFAYCKRQKKDFSLLLIFMVYLYIATTGMFYCRAGSTVSTNIFYIALSVLPLFLNNYITISPNAPNNSYSHH